MRSRMQTRLMVTLLALTLAMTAAGHAQAAATRVPAVQAVASISTTVADVDRSVTFYSTVLSFEKVSDQEMDLGGTMPGKPGPHARVITMKLGDESIELVQFRSGAGQSIPADSRSNDFWFQHIAIIVSDMDRAYEVLTAHKVEAASVAPQRLPSWNKNAAGIRAFYFKDPDGHPLEILEFPAGKGDAKWHRNSGKLFLGIDHTAIVVGDTEASLKFYRDLLGMRIVGESDNYGLEQERLNNVPGAHLRITSLRAEHGPGIELLEYVSPRTGRHLPKAPEITDLVHRQTVLVANNPAALATVLHAKKPAYTTDSLGLIISDPDGHELLIRAANLNSISEK